MKKIISTLSYNYLYVVLAFFCFSEVTQAKTLIATKQLKINNQNQSIDIKDLTLTISISCYYEVFPVNWFGHESCGDKNIDLHVSSDGFLLLPEVETFSGLHGHNLSNYLVSLFLVDKNKGRIFDFTLHGTDILSFFENRDTLNIIELKENRINVTINNSNFFGSAESKEDEAMLFLRIRSSGGQEWGSPGGSSMHWSAYNSKTTVVHNELINTSEIILKPFAYVYFSNFDNYLSFNLKFSRRLKDIYASETIYISLEKYLEINTINLK